MGMVLKYFWFFGAAIGLVNVMISRSSLKKETAEADETAKVELDKFIKWYAVCLTVPFLFLQIFQLLGRYPNMFYIFLADFTNVFYILGILSMGLFWGLIVYLVVCKGGAGLIAQYRRGFRNVPDNPRMIKIFVVLMAVAGCTVLIMGNFFFKDTVLRLP